MSIFAKVKQEDDVKQASEAVQSGGGVRDSHIGIYTIKHAYAVVAKSEAMAVAFDLTDATGMSYRQTIYMTTGKEKGCVAYYVDKKSGDKMPLPGYTVVNNICLATTGEEIHELETEAKTINLYDFELKKEVPTEVEMLTDLVGQSVELAIVKKKEDRQKKDDQGDFVLAGTRIVNEIDRVFTTKDDFEGLTPLEIAGGVTEPKVRPDWLKRWDGKMNDRSSEEGRELQVQADAEKGTNGGSTGVDPSAPKKPKKSLFAKKD